VWDKKSKETGRKWADEVQLTVRLDWNFGERTGHAGLAPAIIQSI
jgi:hypothetical protein